MLHEGVHAISSSAQSKLEFAYTIPSIKGTEVIRLHQENNLERYKSNIILKILKIKPERTQVGSVKHPLTLIGGLLLIGLGWSESKRQVLCSSVDSFSFSNLCLHRSYACRTSKRKYCSVLCCRYSFTVFVELLYFSYLYYVLILF